jgi:nicotinate-nucleotide adenylyltransferase
VTTQVALFGGAFNPPHLAHLFTVQYLLQRADVDEVWLLPSHQHAFGKGLAPFEERARLLRLCVEGLARVSVCEVEREEGVTGRTFDTLALLSERFPDHAFQLVIGADNLTESHRWHRFDELVARWPLIVVGRPGHERSLERVRAELWCSPGPTLPNISSTVIRTALYALSPEARAQLEADQDLRRCPPALRDALSWVPPRALTGALSIYAPPPSEAMSGVCVWGQGRAGGAIAEALTRSGARASSVSIRALLAALLAPAGERDALLEPFRDPARHPVWIIAARDELIEEVSMALASLRRAWRAEGGGWEGARVALHCAGSRGPDLLRALSDEGVAVAQWHPLQALRGRESAPDLAGAAFLVYGDAEGVTEGGRLARAVGGWSLEPPPRFRELLDLRPTLARSLYHSAAVLASGLTLSLFGAAVEVFIRLGWSEAEAASALSPLTRVALERGWSIAEASGGQLGATLTGPIARGDHEVIARHLEALADASHDLSPEVTEVYRALTTWCARWAQERGETSGA